MDDPEPSSRPTLSAPTDAAAGREQMGNACRGAPLSDWVRHGAGSPTGGRGWRAWSYASCATS